MHLLRVAGRTVRRFAPALLFLAAAAVAASADVGGEYRISYGKGRISVKGAGVKPSEFVANVRLAFDGAPADESGTGSVIAYDAQGQSILGEIPMEWITKGNAGFLAEVDPTQCANFLEAQIAEATGFQADCTVEIATAKGGMLRDGINARLSMKATGEVSIDGSPSFPIKLKLHGK